VISPAQEAKTVRFGPFELDLTTCCLTRRGQEERLALQPARLLVLLVQRRGELMSREELRSQLWPGDTFGDFDHGLNNAVNRLREALGDSAVTPRYILTAPRRGYRFIADVELVTTAAAAGKDGSLLGQPAPEEGQETAAGPDIAGPSAPRLRAPTVGYRFAAETSAEESVSTETPQSQDKPQQLQVRFTEASAVPRISRRTFLWAAGVFASIGGAAWLAGRKKGLPPAMSVAVPIVDGTTAADVGQLLGAPVIAPDGSVIVVSLSTSDGAYLFRRPLNSNHMTRMEGTQYASLPFWSPDSQHIGFFADGKLKRMPAFGGSSIVICDVVEPRGGCWNGDNILFAPNLRGIFRIAATGGTAAPVTTLDPGAGENSHRFPMFLPDGKRFLYFSRSSSLDKRGIYLESLDRRQSRYRVLVADGQFALGAVPNSGRHFLITPQAGKLVAQEFDCDSGKAFGVEHILLDHAGQVSASETGALALRTEAQVRSTLVWRDREGRPLGTLGKPDDYWQAAISPDGRFVAVVRHDSLTGVFRAWTASLPYGQMEVVSNTDHVDSVTWSHDGRILYYIDFVERKLFRRSVNPRGPEELVQSIAIGDNIRDVSPYGLTMVVERSTDRIHSVIEWSGINPLQWHLIDSNGFVGNTSLSPDGSSLAFGSNRSGRMEVYLADFPGMQNVRRVSADGGSWPRWRHDGKELFYIADDESLMSVDYPRSERNRGARPKSLFRTALANAVRNPLYDVASDGSRFLLIERDSSISESDVELLLNWPSILSD
jgi:DNA-binding winged helix-turn-helix (wHTH) protein/Tol biopolymer transport system component